jgi:mannose-6-phosphate isomerase
VLKLAQGERHRLIGADGYGIVAEIWRHTDPANPSDENDIVRVQDDFGRKLNQRGQPELECPHRAE